MRETGSLDARCAEQGVADAAVGLGVLEVDRVDLVRHGGRADLARDDPLPEVAQRDVGPDVLVEAQRDRVEAHQGVAQLGDVVVRLDLRGQRVPGQAQAVRRSRREISSQGASG